MTLKDLRAELKQWGRFWAEKESLQGYSATSVTARCCEVLKTGIWTTSDKFLFSHQSDNIYVPWYVAKIDGAMVGLPAPQKAAINKRYVKQCVLSSTERLALLHAETAMLYLF